MEKIKIEVEHRDKTGKGAAKKLRREGYVPAVVYSGDTNSVLSIPVNSLKLLRSAHFSESVVIDMDITGGQKTESMSVFIKSIQFHPLTEKVIHIDFLKVSLTEKIKVHVPVILKGEAKGVKEGGGILDQILRELEIEGLPLDIPEKIEVDISGLEISQSLHISDLNIAGNLKIVTDPQLAVVVLTTKEEETEEEEAVLEETAASQEPEVIKEKKEASGKEAKKEK